MIGQITATGLQAITMAGSNLQQLDLSLQQAALSLATAEQFSTNSYNSWVVSYSLLLPHIYNRSLMSTIQRPHKTALHINHYSGVLYYKVSDYHSFAGANVSTAGVSPNLAKLTAIVNWEQPTTALNLVSFLGITGHFRDLIKDYSCLECPLQDLLKEVELPAISNKSTWQSAHQKHSLIDCWKLEHT